MSAMLSEQGADGTLNHGGEPAAATTSLVVRRHAGLAALIGAGASAVAIAYLWRASQSMLVVDWALCAVMAVIATLYLATFVDSRTPLFVADELGVRIRLGQEWRGLPWDAIDDVVVRPRRGWFRDGRIVLVPRSLTRALEGLEGKGRRQATLNQKMYGAPLAVPLGITTRVSTTGAQTVAQAIAVLMLGRAEVIEIVDTDTPDTGTPEADRLAGATDGEVDIEVEVEERADVEEQADDPRTSRRTLLGGLGTIVSRVGKGRRNDIDIGIGDDVGGDVGGAVEPLPSLTLGLTLPLRETRPAMRAEVTRDIPATGHSELAEDARGNVAERREMRHPVSSVNLVNLVIESDRIRPISTLGDPVEPLVIDDFVTEPAYNPVIGPELAASRTRLGLTVDGLAERTRIRPHVIESIEVDDFAPCGGDFYARGHLRTLARLLGKDPAPLLETFEERYATAPVNARRVFEAELATGSMRSTMAGPNWGLLIGAVLTLILVWGAVRLVSGDPPELVQSPAPVLNGSTGIDRGFPPPEKPTQPAKPLQVMLIAAHADSRVTVRSGDGRVVFTGAMVLGEKKKLEVVPPVRVQAVDGGAIEVVVGRRDTGVLGELGEPGRRTFRRPAELNRQG